MRFQALPEVGHAEDGVDDCADDQEDGDDGEGGEGSSGGEVCFCVRGLVHSD